MIPRCPLINKNLKDGEEGAEAKKFYILRSCTCSAVLLLSSLWILYLSCLRHTLRVISVMLVVTVTTPWSSATPWAACLACATPEALCPEGIVTCALDSARVGREWRACSAPTVPTTTTTGVYSSTVGGRPESEMRDVTVMTVAEIKWMSWEKSSVVFSHDVQSCPTRWVVPGLRSVYL